jgi:predicted ThiF/HesA family dinucleotide-utilizing enzyme
VELCTLIGPVDAARWPVAPQNRGVYLPPIEEPPGSVEERLGHWFPAQIREGWRIVIAGLGTIGSEVALAVARCLLTDIWLFDPQRLEAGNFGVQAYSRAACEAGLWKVTAARRLIADYPCAQKLVTIPHHLNRHEARALLDGPPVILMTGLDSIPGRLGVWRSVKSLGVVKCLIDGRLSGPFVEVRTVDFASPTSIAFYEQTAFPPTQPGLNSCGKNAYPGARLTVAGLMMDKLHAFLDRDRLAPIQTMNLHATRSGHNPMINWRMPDGGR